MMVTLPHGPAPTCSPLCNKFAGSSGDCVHHVSAGNLQNIRKVPLLESVPRIRGAIFGCQPQKLEVRGQLPLAQERGATAAEFPRRGQLVRCRPRCPLWKPDSPRCSSEPASVQLERTDACFSCQRLRVGHPRRKRLHMPGSVLQRTDSCAAGRPRAGTLQAGHSVL